MNSSSFGLKFMITFEISQNIELYSFELIWVYCNYIPTSRNFFKAIMMIVSVGRECL
jgi:hypothetical protein